MSYTSVDYNGVYANPDNQYADLKKYNTVFGPKPLPQPNQSHPTLLQQPNPFGYNALSHGNGDAYYDVKTGYGTNCDQKYYTGMCPSNRRVGPFPPRMKENYHPLTSKPLKSLRPCKDANDQDCVRGYINTDIDFLLPDENPDIDPRRMNENYNMYY